MKIRSTEGAALAFLLGLAGAGCGDPLAAISSSSASVSSTATAPKPAKPASSEMPAVTVDDKGPYINGVRPDMKQSDGPTKLHEVVAALPIGGKEVRLVVLPKSKVSDVIAVVHELGLAGAPTVRIKADARKDLPGELVVVPLSKVADKPVPCSVIAMVEKDLSTSIWAIQGGIGKKHDKGLAGPDLSNAGETLQKELKKCESTVAFFAAEPTLGWELAQNVGGTVITSDTEKKIKTLVLIEDAPVPGRVVKLAP